MASFNDTLLEQIGLHYNEGDCDVKQEIQAALAKFFKADDERNKKSSRETLDRLTRIVGMSRRKMPIDGVARNVWSVRDRNGLVRIYIED